jgi:flagellar biosynthesis/type III secretory pathway protein FliH
MSESDLPADADLAAAARRFDGALTRLERVLASAVADVAELGRRTGYADGHAAGLAEGKILVSQPPDPPGSTLDDELARAALMHRNAELEQAVGQARAALDAAIDDIRGALGQV